MPDPRVDLKRPLTGPNDPDLRLCWISDRLLRIPPEERWNMRVFGPERTSRLFTGSEAYEAMMFLHKLGLSMEAVKR